jgi:hypothetical protein
LRAFCVCLHVYASAEELAHTSMHRAGHVIYLPVSASIKGCGCICIQWLLSSHTESWACVCIYWFVSRRWSWVAFLAFIKNWGIYLHFFVSRAERVVACVCKYWELVTSYVGSRRELTVTEAHWFMPQSDACMNIQKQHTRIRAQLQSGTLIHATVWIFTRVRQAFA